MSNYYLNIVGRMVGEEQEFLTDINLLQITMKVINIINYQSAACF